MGIVEQLLYAIAHAKRISTNTKTKKDPTMDDYNRSIAEQSKQHTNIINIIDTALNEIIRALPYIPQEVRDDMNTKLNLYKDNLPIYVQNIKPVYVPKWDDKHSWYRHMRRRWGKRYRGPNHYHGGWKTVLSHYTFDLNDNFRSQVINYINIAQLIITDIGKTVFNNCDNPNTLLNEQGMLSCGMNDEIRVFKEFILPYKKKSNYVMSLIKNTKDFPQYKQAEKVDNYINRVYDWYPMDTRSDYNNGYAKITMTKMKSSMSLWKGKISALYDLCISKNTHVGVDDNNVPICIKDDYINASNRCGQAIQMSKTYEYGTDKLTDLWTDVSNSVPGNLVGGASTILNTSNASCKKWVDMFNIWEEMEQKALAEPCIPERPIASANDQVLIKMASDWNKSASDHIKQLKIRLLKIQTYIKNYPNVLNVKKEGITLAPSSMTPTAIIKKDYSQSNDGEAPMQHLEMIVPNGKPGKQGNIGITGIEGSLGKRGVSGPQGKVGNNDMPSFYDILKR